MKQKFNSDIVIGLEIHIELNTETKLFCSCRRTGSDEPNTRTCEVCLGMPGSKPVLNEKALNYALKLALALKMDIAKELIFSRKSYFYPDMPKNYQITQYEIPLGKNGFLKVNNKKIRIKRLHIEEDPAALVHPSGIAGSEYVLIDYNRAGNPLVEVVTEPDISSAKEAREFMKKLITLLEYLEIFDKNNCIIKADANVSIRESNFTRVEIKNISGFKDIERALSYEIERQEKEVNEAGVVQETRAWDSNKGITFSLRKKETEEDYGYIIDPDLVKIEITDEMIKKIKEETPELEDEKFEKFKTTIKEEMARILAKNKDLAKLFEEISKEVKAELAASYVRKEVPRVLNYNKISLKESKINGKRMIQLLKLVEEGKISDNVAKKILEKMVKEDFDVNKYVEEKNLLIVKDIDELRKICEKIVKENKQVIEDIKKGNKKAFHFLIGLVMKETKGKADAKEVNKILKDLLKV